MHENQVTQRLIRALNSLPGCRAKKRHGGKFQSGDPDIAGAYQGHAFFIEVKLPKGKLTPLQEHELKLWDKAGATSLIAVWFQESQNFWLTHIRERGNYSALQDTAGKGTSDFSGVYIKLAKIEQLLDLLPVSKIKQIPIFPALKMCPACDDPWSYHKEGSCAMAGPGGGSCGCREQRKSV